MLNRGFLAALAVIVLFATGCATVTEIKDFSMVQVVMREEGGQVTLLPTSQANAGSYRFG